MIGLQGYPLPPLLLCTWWREKLETTYNYMKIRAIQNEIKKISKYGQVKYCLHTSRRIQDAYLLTHFYRVQITQVQSVYRFFLVF